MTQTAAMAVLAALLMAGLYFGRPLLVPFALAVLLAFVLAGPVRLLERLGLPAAMSVISTVLVAMVLIGVLGSFIGVQLGNLAAELPHYQRNLTQKIESLRGVTSGSKLVESGSDLVKKLDNAIANGNGKAARGFTEVPPLPVQIRQPDLEPLQVIEQIVDPLLEPLATFAIVIIFVIFILLGKDELRNRFITLVGSRDLKRASIAMDEGAQRLSRYLLTQTGVNAGVGITIGIGLWLIGVPNPALWGLIVAIFRYVPYVGVPAAAALPLALALAVDPGWSKLLMTAALYFVVEATAGQAIEPYVYGRNMGLAPIAVLLAAAFWTWVWGPVGLLLSVPLTMCLVVLGRHVEHFRFLEILLGDQPALSDEERFYLRVMKGNPEELTQQAETLLRTMRLGEYVDQVAMRGLALAQLDSNRGATLTAEDGAKILTAVEGLIENLIDAHEPENGEIVSGLDEIGFAKTMEWENDPVLCVADRGALNMAAALLLKELLRRYGVGTRIVSAEDASAANLDMLDKTPIRVVCLSYLEPGDPAAARYMVRRLRKWLPHAAVVAGFWSATQDDTHVLDWIEATGADYVVADLSTTVAEIVTLLQKSTGTETPSLPARQDEQIPG